MSGRMRVLFVDGESDVLNGLRRMLQPMRAEWGIPFVASGQAALEAIDKHPFDVVVSETQAPDMDGTGLFDGERTRCPLAVRIIVSGHADPAMVLRSVGAAVTFHHRPSDCLCRSLAVLTPVHVADALVRDTELATDEKRQTAIDVRCLEAVGVADHLPQCRELSRAVPEQQAEPRKSATRR
jgi:DNA-binding NtrC family response regulator